MQTGLPAQPAANVARLAPGFEHSFSLLPFLIAVTATLAWIGLVKWRVGRHRAAIWKSLILPASGATLSWLLLMTLWLPLLDFARSYEPLVRRTVAVVGHPDCVEVHDLNRGQIAAFEYHGHLVLKPVDGPIRCPWLISGKDAGSGLPDWVDLTPWSFHSIIRHPSDRYEDVVLYRRKTDISIGTTDGNRTHI